MLQDPSQASEFFSLCLDRPFTIPQIELAPGSGGGSTKFKNYIGVIVIFK